MKLGILILLNMAPPQKLVLAPGAIIRGNTVFHVLPTNVRYCGFSHIAHVTVPNILIWTCESL